MKKKILYFIIIVIVLLLIKVVWVWCANHNIGSWDTEKSDLLSRSNYLAEKVITTPNKLFFEMPSEIGPQFQGEWALYSCSMYVKALANLSTIYPETKDVNIARMDSLISIALSPEIRWYDKKRWGEDPLKSLDGNNSHISYLSHIAWMIGNYKSVSDDEKYDEIYKKICDTINRRILSSPSLNLPTYPEEVIYVPDMLVAILALNDYAKNNRSKYAETVNNWLSNARAHWLDKETGLLVSFLDNDGKQIEDVPLKGSYTALNCYYLSLIDYDFGKEQYELMKELYIRHGLLARVKEYVDCSPIIEEDIDAGIILFGLSPSGTAFAIGPATIFNDQTTRSQLLRTAEIAGHTKFGQNRHYMLANLALVGEAITLAMRTTTMQR